MILVHASCVAVGGAGVLIRGPSGAGKSDLALRLIDGGARLVADDQTALTVAAGGLVADVPATIAGLIEVRGVGVVRLPFGPAPVGVVVDLVAPSEVDRLPEGATVEILGVLVPIIRLAGFEASAAAKVRLAVRLATRDIMTVT